MVESGVIMQPQTKTQPKFTSRVYAYRVNPPQSIPNNAWTTLLFSAEAFDTMAEFNPATGIFTAKRSGYYLIIARATWQCAVLASTRQIALITTSGTFGHFIWQPNVLFEVHTTETSAIVYLNVGDTARAQVWQGSGFAENLVNAAGVNYANVFEVHRLS